MPKLFATAGSSHGSLIPNDGRVGHALTQLIVSLKAPSDLQGVLTVTCNAVRCVYAFLNFTRVSSVEIWNYAGSLNDLSKALKDQGVSEQPMACAGRNIRFSQWTLLHSIHDEWDTTVLAGTLAVVAFDLAFIQRGVGLPELAFGPQMGRCLQGVGQGFEGFKCERFGL